MLVEADLALRRWGCEARTWSEVSDHIRPRAVLTERARPEMCRRVGEDIESVAEPARAFGVGWNTAMADRLRTADPGQVIDRGRDGVPACRHRHTAYATGIVDLDRSQLFDVVPGRSGRC